MKKKTFLTTLSIAAVAIVSLCGGIKVYENHAYENHALLMANIEALSQLEAVMGKTATPGQVTCNIYKGDKLVTGRKSVCEQAANINVACVPDVCMIPDR